MDNLTSTEPDVDAAFELADLRSAATGLPFVVFVSQQGGARHGRASKSARCAATIRPRRPRSRWNTRPVLEACWDGRIEFTKDMFARIKPVWGVGMPPLP